MIDPRYLRFLADMRAQPGGGGAVGGPGASSSDPSHQNPTSPNSQNFDLARYQAERDAVSMARVSLNMERSRYSRRQTVEICFQWILESAEGLFE